MMENKCNKTPNSNNNNKYMDHVYCHPSDNKSFIRANNNTHNNNNSNNASGAGAGGTSATAGSDVLSLIKENKQLKAMLLLHLDLIQEQQDQMLIKDKQCASQMDELLTLRTRNKQLETQVQELQKQLQRQLKRERSSLPPPPLAKIQCKTEPVQQKNTIIGECNGKLISKIILHRVNMSGRSPNSTTTASDTASEADERGAKEHAEVGEEEEDEEGVKEEPHETDNTTEDSNDASTSAKAIRKRSHAAYSKTISRGAKPHRSVLASATLHTISETTTTVPTATATALTATAVTAATKSKATATVTTSTTVTSVATATAPVQVCVTPSTPSRGKQMPLMLWHNPDVHSDESVSCDSIGDVEQCSRSPVTTHRSSNDTKKSQNSSSMAQQQLQQQQSHRHHHHAKSRRCPYISTSQRYCTREWEDENFSCDQEFIREEANALLADAPMLEIPKWTEHELTVSYCIEGTEDLTDDTFLKRHTKLEIDEKRRKKWDVQQIREQRRIEKLKRRHCKDEIQTSSEQQNLLSFYPQPDSVQTIYYTNDVPVQAFGEMIPKVQGIHSQFYLPWQEVHSVMPSTSVAAIGQHIQASSFHFLNKRKRQQSSLSLGTARQRSIAAAKTAAAAAAAATTVVSNANETMK